MLNKVLIFAYATIYCSLALSPSEITRNGAMDGSKWLQINPRFEGRFRRQAPDGTNVPVVNDGDTQPSSTEDSCPMGSSPKYRNDTRYNTIKHQYSFNDITTKADVEKGFPDMGYLVFGYDLFKGNVLSYGFDPGFRNPIFDHQTIDSYQTTVDGRHTQPFGLTALPSQACHASFKMTTISTMEDLQARQGSAYSEGSGFGFDGSELAASIPDAASANPKVAAIVAAIKTAVSSSKASHASLSNEEYKSEFQSSLQENSQTIIAEAQCDVYQAKLNQRRPPPLLTEVKDWLKTMLGLQKDDKKEELRKEIIKFYDYYGTHIVTEANFGARYMYNFTMTSKNEATVNAQYGSFMDAVNTEIGAFGFSLNGQSSRNEVDESKSAKKRFNELVEINVESVGAPFPQAPRDSIAFQSASVEWANRAIENPVPTQVTLIGMENILNEEMLGEAFNEFQQEGQFTKKNINDLRDRFWIMRPRKVVTAVERKLKHCLFIPKIGEDLKDVKRLFRCVEIALQLKKEDSTITFADPLLTVLLLNHSEEERTCVKDSKAVTHMDTVLKILKDKLGVDLFRAETLMELDEDSSILDSFNDLDNCKKNCYDKFKRAFKGDEEPDKCKDALQNLLENGIGGFITSLGRGLLNLLKGTSEKEKKECQNIVEDYKRKLNFWNNYGRKILRSIAPENLAKACYEKEHCCETEETKIGTLIGGPRGSYVEHLSNNGGLPEGEVQIWKDIDVKTTSVEEVQKRLQEDLETTYKREFPEPCVRCNDKEQFELNMCEDKKKETKKSAFFDLIQSESLVVAEAFEPLFPPSAVKKVEEPEGMALEFK